MSAAETAALRLLLDHLSSNGSCTWAEQARAARARMDDADAAAQRSAEREQMEAHR